MVLKIYNNMRLIIMSKLREKLIEVITKSSEENIRKVYVLIVYNSLDIDSPSFIGGIFDSFEKAHEAWSQFRKNYPGYNIKEMTIQ